MIIEEFDSEQLGRIAHYLEVSGYRTVAAWALDSDYSQGEGEWAGEWFDEDGNNVNPTVQLWWALEAASVPEGVRDTIVAALDSWKVPNWSVIPEALSGGPGISIKDRMYGVTYTVLVTEGES
jgi:hypothetical protein